LPFPKKSFDITCAKSTLLCYTPVVLYAVLYCRSIIVCYITGPGDRSHTVRPYARPVSLRYAARLTRQAIRRSGRPGCASASYGTGYYNGQAISARPYRQHISQARSWPGCGQPVITPVSCIGQARSSAVVINLVLAYKPRSITVLTSVPSPKISGQAISARRQAYVNTRPYQPGDSI
jgi:hypothetical protein